MPGMPPGDASQQEPVDNGKLIDMSDKIEKSSCYARNVASGYPMTNLFIGDSRLGCKSDADEQLIIHIEFQEFVKMHSIKLIEFNSGIDPEQRPTIVKIFVNRVNIGFEDVDDFDPTTVLELAADDLSESSDPIPLKYVLFQRVKSITLFVEDNAGGEISALGGMKILGRPVASTNMKDFKKQG